LGGERENVARERRTYLQLAEPVGVLEAGRAHGLRLLHQLLLVLAILDLLSLGGYRRVQRILLGFVLGRGRARALAALLREGLASEDSLVRFDALHRVRVQEVVHGRLGAGVVDLERERHLR
jgi:hypothetical protein